MKFPPSPPNPELEALLKRSAEMTAAMTPAQKAEMSLRQSVSYVRGEMGIEHPDWSEERLNEVTQHMPQAWALSEIDRLRLALAHLSVSAPHFSDGKHEPDVKVWRRMKQYAKDVLFNPDYQV